MDEGTHAESSGRVRRFPQGGVCRRMSETRKLAAILVADVVGYSRLTGADEDRILARLRTLRSDLIDPTIAVHHGRVVKRTGDGAIVEFRSAVDAVNFAIEIQRAMAERNAEVAPDKPNSASASISATSSRRATATLWATASISPRACKASPSPEGFASPTTPTGRSSRGSISKSAILAPCH